MTTKSNPPAKRKKPQDHQSKNGPREVTVRGVTITVDPAMFNDLDMFEDLYDLQNAENDENGLFKIIPFLRKVCGPAYQQVKRVLRDPDTGRIPMETVQEFTAELMSELNPNS
ncbi:hypothetical protein JS533_001700 [Bifidobacterium amazonense]|uniref:Tail assembly chaperone n=1 Tax=Bifidobacterium amazonense TaxID=2809027 RepID=A0ABS9VSD5_9BIFI|nr:hypothetical protein [Bifidobacterium amazonense]MCH9275003.1 hypothetical protein [Bifidobacterium amazonense]